MSGKGRRQGQRKYDEHAKEQARLAYLSGATPSEIAGDIGCSDRTVRQWAKKDGWQTQLSERRSVAAHLEQQIAYLSKGTPTESRARRIAMLTRALERLKKLHPTPAPRPSVRREIAVELLDKAMGEDFGLYPYQKNFIRDDSRFRCIVKSRQIGFSYTLALDCLLSSAAGRNQIILSASQDQSDILIDYAIQHASRLGITLDAQSKSELSIGTSTIRALPANQRTVQGFNGDVTLDEFAWHHKPKAIWRAVLPSVTAVGGRVTVCSTPFVPGNLFWAIVENHRNRFSQFLRTRITIHDAIAQGMPLPGGLDELRSLFDAESWAMMFECQWAEDGTAVLSWEQLHELATAPGSCSDWEEPVYIGIDVGRTNHKFAIAIVGHEDDHYRLLKVIERKGATFAEMRALAMETVVMYRVRRMQIDRTGIGMQLAEELEIALPGIAVGRTFTNAWKGDAALNIAKLAEEKRLELLNEPGLLAQLHAVKKSVSGNTIRYDAKADDEGHADVFWALALALDRLGRPSTSDIVVELW